MLKRFSILAFVLLALSWNFAAHAKDSATQAADRRAIVAAYAKMDRAFLKKDTDSMMAHIAPDFMAYSKSYGVFDRAGYQRIMRVLEAVDTRVISSSTQITKWQWRGPDAVVWVSSKNRMQSGRGTLLSWDTTRHYWGKIGGKWQIRQEVTLAYKSLLNGKPLR